MSATGSRTWSVTFVELTTYEGVLPLASGCLQVYAAEDPEIAAACRFHIYSTPLYIDREIIVRELADCESDVYAFSCYLWNMRLMRHVVARLVALRPDAQFILGGPQVMHHAADYILPEWENVVVCNGEGERTFRAYLGALVRDDLDPAAVPGISYWADGVLMTTRRSERITDLMEIPSPFTAGVFEPGRFQVAILETNRGCPFSCAFCAWGAATNDKVHQFGDQRVYDDITWIAQNSFVSVFIADANWGIGPRDVKFTEHFVSCKQKYGFPYRVDMAAAKNRPDRMAVITETLAKGGLLTSQPISMQSLSEQTLETIQRTNIRLRAYTDLQRMLKHRRISSHIELIWPLPGETLSSYQDGIAQLCRSGADTMVVYPQLLLHNTPIYEQRDVLGVRTTTAPDDSAEAEIVTATNWVSRSEYEDGVWFAYAMHSLYNLRGLYYLANHLDRSGIVPFDALYRDAVAYLRTRTDSPIVQYFATSVRDLGNYDFRDQGTVTYLVLHEHRGAFDRLMTDFASSRPWWSSADARAAFALDLLTRPYAFAEPAGPPSGPIADLPCVQEDEYRFTVTLPRAIAGLVAELEMPEHTGPAPTEVVVQHSPDRKLPLGTDRSSNILYCNAVFVSLRDILPTIGPAS